jgi:hypothetical protein
MKAVQPICPQCSQPMKLVRTIPALGPAWPALLVFFCSDCNHADTKENDCLAVARDARPAEHTEGIGI